MKAGKHFYEFGPFRMDPSQCLLFRDNQPVPLQPKAFATLLMLVKNSERVVLKEDLLKTVWPDTFVEESNLTQNVFVLRKILGDTASQRRYIVTVPGRGYRFAEAVRTVLEREEAPEREEVEEEAVEDHMGLRLVIEEEEDGSPVPPATDAAGKARRFPGRVAVAAAAAVLALSTVGFLSRHRPKLGAKDTVVLADFANLTGDAVFDGTLRRALAAQLEQSPFLNLLSDQRVGQTLSLMSRLRDASLTPELARELCQRTAGAAVLNGSIAQLGGRYLLTLKAVNCANGESLASTEGQAKDKDHVLDALGKIASDIRSKLGESLASVQRYDAPPENVTTGSLEALQAYSLGYVAAVSRGNGVAAIPLFHRAIGLDASFAMAYARLGVIYFNSGEPVRAAENLRKAYALRERVSDREKFYIEAHQADIVTGDFEAARNVYELWAQIYPSDDVPLANLGVIYGFLGDWDKAFATDSAARQLNPGSGNVAGNFIHDLIKLNRPEQARAAVREADALHLLSPGVHANNYTIDFLLHDTQGMEREAAAVTGMPGWEDGILYLQSETAAYGGHFTQARDLAGRAVDSARRSDKKETSASYQAVSAVREALAGDFTRAKQQAAAALACSNATDVQATSAIALGLAGERAQAQRLAAGLGTKYPEDTRVQYTFLPAIQAAAALPDDPRKALEALAVAARYELGQNGFVCLLPVYLRGTANLAAHHGAAAEADFQKILDHPGLVLNESIGALAHLGLARASLLAGDVSKARVAYQDFFSLWKDADSDLPVLRQAKAEFAKLP